MTDTAAVQQKVNDTRARLDESLHALNNRIEPKAIMEQSMTYLSDHGPDVARSGLDFVRDNPLAVGLAAAGLAWLALGGGPTSREIARGTKQRLPFGSDNFGDEEFDPNAFDVYANDKFSGDYQPHHLAGRSGPDSLAASVADKASELSGQMSEKASAAAEGISDAAVSAANATREFSGDVANSSREAFDAGVRYAESAARSTAGYGSKQLRERPLAVGAVALIGGAALAMMLPRTRAEAEVMGDQARAAREMAVRKSQQAYASAKARAGDAMDVVKQHANEAAEAVKTQVADSPESSGKVNSSAGLGVGATETAASGSKVVTADADGSSGRGSRAHSSPASTEATHDNPDKLRPATKADENKTRQQLNS